LAIGLGSITIISALTMSSCRDKFTTQYDTLVKTDTLNMCSCDTGWMMRSSGTNSTLIISHFVSPTLGFAGGTNGTLLKTTDTGTTWQTLPPVAVAGNSGTGIYGLWFFDAMNGVAVGDGQNIFQTYNGGNSWSATPFSSSFIPRCLYFINQNVGFIGTTDPGTAGGDGEIWRTSDGGSSWSKVYICSTGAVFNIEFTSFNNGIATGNYGAAMWTTDAGLTWNQGTMDQSTMATHTAFISPMVGFASAGPANGDTTYGALLQTSDGGHSWHTIMNTPYLLQAMAANAKGVITAAGWTGNTLESTDGGLTWKHNQVGSNRWVRSEFASPTREVMIGGNGSIATGEK